MFILLGGATGEEEELAATLMSAEAGLGRLGTRSGEEGLMLEEADFPSAETVLAEIGASWERGLLRKSRWSDFAENCGAGPPVTSF